MKSLINLPDVIFTLLQTFLSSDDYHYFLNTSKLHFSHLKRRTIIFQLTDKRSEQYMKDKEFRELLLNKVEDGWRQIRLKGETRKFSSSLDFSRLMEVYDASVPHDGYYFDPSVEALRNTSMTMKTIPQLSPRLKDVTLEFYNHFKDANNLSHLTRLVLYYCHELEDISPLRHIPDLTFWDCARLKDFSIFKKENSIRKLEICSCPLFEDVSPLRGIYDLSIRYCKAMKDISGLGDHHRLEISNCAHRIVGYESLVGIPHVKLVWCDISDLSVLRYAKTVELPGCTHIRDIRPIKRARRVMIPWIEETAFSELSDVYDLDVWDLDSPDVLLTLTNPKLRVNLSLINSEEMVEGLLFPNTHHLDITDLSPFLLERLELGNIPFLQHLQTLIIDCIATVTKIKGLEDIPNVKLFNLDDLSDISGLGRNRSVEMWYCPMVEDVTSLATVGIVTIGRCEGITDYSVLSKVPRLKVFPMIYESNEEI